MIIYSETKDIFFYDVKTNRIVDAIRSNFLDKGLACGNESEMNAWNNSMQFMKNILDHQLIPDDINVAIEYKIPFSEKRIDFIVTGLDVNNKKSIVIVEIKQWKLASDTNKNDLVSTFVGKDNREVLHPSYQANQYKYLLTSFNKSINEGKINCYSCAYLHNASKEKNINLLNVTLYNYLDESPIYFKDDYEELQNKLIELTRNGKGREILYEVENGEIVPAKKLIDVVGSTINGNKEYELIDSQKIVFENIIEKANEKK